MHPVTPLKAILLAEGRSQTWLSKATGIDRPTVCRIANGLHTTEGNREKIAAALGREVSDVFDTATLRDAA
jgi:hypothetical protein